MGASYIYSLYFCSCLKNIKFFKVVLDSWIVCFYRKAYFIVSGRSGWSDSTDTVQRATTEANLASTEPRRRHGKGLNIRYPKVTGKVKSEDKKD